MHDFILTYKAALFQKPTMGNKSVTPLALFSQSLIVMAIGLFACQSNQTRPIDIRAEGTGAFYDGEKDSSVISSPTQSVLQELPTLTSKPPVYTLTLPVFTPNPPTSVPKPLATLVSPITNLVLVNADLDKDIDLLRNGDVINLNSSTSNLSVKAVVSSSQIESVIFYLDDRQFCMNDQNRCVENTPPYAMAGDLDGNYYNNWNWSSLLGTHTITAVPCRQDGGQGLCETPFIVTFTVVDR